MLLLTSTDTCGCLSELQGAYCQRIVEHLRVAFRVRAVRRLSNRTHAERVDVVAHQHRHLRAAFRGLQGYLAHNKQCPTRPLQLKDY